MRSYGLHRRQVARYYLYHDLNHRINHQHLYHMGLFHEPTAIIPLLSNLRLLCWELYKRLAGNYASGENEEGQRRPQHGLRLLSCRPRYRERGIWAFERDAHSRLALAGQRWLCVWLRLWDLDCLYWHHGLARRGKLFREALAIENLRDVASFSLVAPRNQYIFVELLEK